MRSARVLAFAAAVEIGTGIVLILDPAIPVRLLLGEHVSGAGSALARCFGIALLALGVACVQAPWRGGSEPPALRGMLVYNALIALYLAYLGAVWATEGPLLWPAAALHAIVATLLLWPSAAERLKRQPM